MAALGGPQNQREVFVDRSRHDVSASTAVSAGIVTTPNLTVDLTRSAPVISLRTDGHILGGLLAASPWQQTMKRAVDIVGASLALVLLSPLFLLTALSIVATSRGPVFFRQARVGFRGKPFGFIKFRSMVHDAEARRESLGELNKHETGPIFKVNDDPRVTRVGHIIRRTSIDELPQLFHVLKGTMSLVGPRPLPYQDLDANYHDLPSDMARSYASWKRLRKLAKPGLSGIWQVSGRSELDFQEWMWMDLEYIESWTLWLDITLLARTVPAVLSGRGAY